METRISFNAGYVVLRSPDLGNTTAPSWADALNLIHRAFNDTVIARVEQGSHIQLMTIHPDGTVEPTTDDHTPILTLTVFPWSVSAPELSATPALAADAAGAFTLARQAIAQLPGRPIEVDASITHADGRVETVRVTRGDHMDGDKSTLVTPASEVPPESFDVDSLYADADSHTINNDQATVAIPLGAHDVSFEPSVPNPEQYADLNWDDDEDVSFVRARAEKLRTKKTGRLVALVGGALALVLIMGGVLIGATLAPSEAPEEKQAEGLTRSVIGPFSSETVWSRPIARNSRIGATPDGAYVGTISSTQAFIVSNAETGEEVSSIPITSSPSLGPRGTTIGGKPAIVIRDGDHIKAWRDGADALKIDLGRLDTPTHLSFSGDEPLVASDDGVRTWRITDKGLEPWTSLPKGTVPYSMTKDGHVLVGAVEPYRILRLDKVGKTVGTIPLTAPKEGYTPVRWIGVRADIAVIVWAENPDGGGIARVYSSKDGKVLSDSPIDRIADVRSASLIAGDRSHLVAIPGLVIDSRSGDTTKAPGFTPSAAVGDMVLGRDATGARAAYMDGKVQALQASDVMPWTLTKGGRAVVTEKNVAYAVKSESEIPRSKDSSKDTEEPKDTKNSGDTKPPANEPGEKSKPNEAPKPANNKDADNKPANNKDAGKKPKEVK